MKYKLIIDKNAEEEIIAVVHAPSSLTQQIEDLVCSFSGADSIMGSREDEMRKLTFQEIECVTIIDRKVIAVDTKGNHYSLKDRLRDLEDILKKQPMRCLLFTQQNWKKRYLSETLRLQRHIFCRYFCTVCLQRA